MRYDKPIFFRRVIPGEYNADTGNYGENNITEEKRYASVTDTGAQTLNIVYGTIKQGSLTIRLQRPFKQAFDQIRIGEKIYHVDMERHLRNFVISEVQ